MDVVVSGNFWTILARPCFERGLAVNGCSTAETLPKHGLPLPAMCKVKNRFARVCTLYSYVCYLYFLYFNVIYEKFIDSNSQLITSII